jgi:hypothetical protein
MSGQQSNFYALAFMALEIPFSSAVQNIDLMPSGAQVVQDCLMGRRCLAEPSEKAFAAISSMTKYNAVPARKQISRNPDKGYSLFRR